MSRAGRSAHLQARVSHNLAMPLEEHVAFLKERDLTLKLRTRPGRLRDRSCGRARCERTGTGMMLGLWIFVVFGILRLEVALTKSQPPRVPNHVGAEHELNDAAADVFPAVTESHPE
jgi:hypothetical protein